MPNALVHATDHPPGGWLYSRVVTPEVEALMARIPKPTGSFGYDAWGYNERAARVGIGVARALYRHYFRVVPAGLQHVPRTGPCLIVGNHAGPLPFDAAMVAVALATNPGGPRAPRPLVDRALPTLPWAGNLVASLGGVPASRANACRLLEAGEAVMVFPEGARGSAKTWKERYSLLPFGQGFVRLAQEQGVPIIPVGIVGAEEAMLTLGNADWLAKAMGLPYWPLVLPFVLPVRMRLHFGAPLVFDGAPENTTTAMVARRVEEVREAIRRLMDEGLAARERDRGRPDGGRPGSLPAPEKTKRLGGA